MFAGLVVSYYSTRNMADIMLVVPKISGTSIPAQTIEETTEMMLTHKTRRFENVTALNTTTNVVLIETNHNLPFVMNHHIVNGSFFREDAVRYNHRAAVLNKRAAFELFGTTTATGNELIIRGLTYVVTGVINDLDNDVLNIYTPTTPANSTIETIAISTDCYTSTITENDLSQIGINTNQYSFVNFNTLRALKFDKIILALFFTLICALIFILKKIIKTAQNQILTLRRLTKEVYFMDLLKNMVLYKLLAVGLSAVSIIILIALLFNKTFWRILTAIDARGILTNVLCTSFTLQISEMTKFYTLSNVFFVGFIAVVIIFWYRYKPYRGLICWLKPSRHH